MNTVALAYAFTCLGFCLGVAVMAVLRGPRRIAAPHDASPPPRRHTDTGPLASALRRRAFRDAPKPATERTP